MENKQKSKLEEFKSLYGHNSGNLKWVPKGGVLLKYIGNDVVFVDFKKENGEWKSTLDQAHVIAIDNYDPVSMTYDITYTLASDPLKEKIVEKIIPEGFTFDIMGQGLQESMHRFIPIELHCAVLSEELFYQRVGKLFDSKPTLDFEALKVISGSKEQDKTLKYARNLVAAVRPTKKAEDNPDELEYLEDIFVFRIHELRLRREGKGFWKLLMYDDQKKLYSVTVNENEPEEFYELYIGQEYIGDLKVIDLIGSEEDSN